MSNIATYTIELRKIIDLYGKDTVKAWFKDYDISNYLTKEQVNQIGLADVFDKDKLANMILNHYYMREIGFETPALFKHYVKTTMEEIMEKYAFLIYSNSFDYNILNNVDYTETYTRDIIADNNIKDNLSSNTTNNTQSNSNDNETINNDTIFNGKQDTNNNSNSSGLRVGSDTPQGQINKMEILQGNYASITTANEDTENNTTTNTQNDKTTNNSERDNTSVFSGSSTQHSNASNTSTSNSNSKTDYNFRRVGNMGYFNTTNQKLIEQYRQNIITIYTSIINDLNILFFALY